MGPTAVSSHPGTYGGLQTTGQAPGDARGQKDHQELQQTGQGPPGIWDALPQRMAQTGERGSAVWESSIWKILKKHIGIMLILFRVY